MLRCSFAQLASYNSPASRNSLSAHDSGAPIMPSVRLPFLFAALLFANSLAVAQSSTASRINQDILSKIPERMHNFVVENTVAGVVTLVAHGNDIVEFDAQGSADVQSTQPMRKDTIFQIMSMTKPVTAIGIMMLAEEGKLSLRDPVDRYLPEFKNLQVVTNTGPDAARLSEPEHAIT